MNAVTHINFCSQECSFTSEITRVYNHSTRLAHRIWGEVVRDDVQLIALRVLAMMSVSFAGVAIALASYQIISTTSAIVSVLTLLGCASVTIYNSNWDSFENPDKIRDYQAQAANQSLETAVSQFGWANLLQWGLFTPEQFVQKYRQQITNMSLKEILAYHKKVSDLLEQTPTLRYEYVIPSPFESRHLWRKETADIEFTQLIKDYPVELLEKYNLLETGELNKIKELKRVFEIINGQTESKLSSIEDSFRQMVSGPNQIFQEKLNQIKTDYESSQVVKTISALDEEYLTKHQDLINLYAEKKRLARAHFQQSVQQWLTPAGVLRPDLDDSSILQYLNFFNELSASESSYESLAQEDLIQLQNKKVRVYNSLLLEEASLKESCEKRKSEAKSCYDDAIRNHVEEKAKLVDPIKRRYKESILDLNSCYRLYVKSISGV